MDVQKHTTTIVQSPSQHHWIAYAVAFAAALCLLLGICCSLRLVCYCTQLAAVILALLLQPVPLLLLPLLPLLLLQQAFA
jgi:hypothetical protein